MRRKSLSAAGNIGQDREKGSEQPMVQHCCLKPKLPTPLSSTGQPQKLAVLINGLWLLL